MIAKGYKFYMVLNGEIFRNLLVAKFKNYGYQFQSLLGALCFRPIPKYCYVWYEGISCISRWSDSGPSWPSCNSIRLIHLCDKKNLTLVDCWDKLVLKSVIKLAKGSHNNISQDWFNKILSQHLPHDRSCISYTRLRLAFLASSRSSFL